MTVKEYTKEFYRLTIRASNIEEYVEKVTRYINNLRYDIQDEIRNLFMKILEDAYQGTLKKEEKLERKHSQKNRRRVITRHKGQSSNTGGFQTPRDKGGSSRSSSQSSIGGKGRGGREIICYTYEKTCHMSWDCPENKSIGQKNENIA
jgi:hypothetical protein